jgi:hypothetical protein
MVDHHFEYIEELRVGKRDFRRVFDKISSSAVGILASRVGFRCGQLLLVHTPSVSPDIPEHGRMPLPFMSEGRVALGARPEDMMRETSLCSLELPRFFGSAFRGRPLGRLVGCSADTGPRLAHRAETTVEELLVDLRRQPHQQMVPVDDLFERWTQQILLPVTRGLAIGDLCTPHQSAGSAFFMCGRARACKENRRVAAGTPCGHVSSLASPSYDRWP